MKMKRGIGVGVMAVMAVVISFAIYRVRVDVINDIYGGHEMPDVSESQPDRIKRQSEKHTAEVVAKVAADHAAFTNCLDARVKLFEIYQQLGAKPKALEPCGHNPRHN